MDKTDIGDEGKVAYISTKTPSRLQRLVTMGITPGRRFRLQQKSPSYVIQVGETQIALEEDVAKEIYVQPKRRRKRRRIGRR